MRQSVPSFLHPHAAAATRRRQICADHGALPRTTAVGCDAEAAVILAVHPEIAVAEACDLIRGGCDPRTAIRILLCAAAKTALRI